MTQTSGAGHFGQAGIATGGSRYNTHSFLIRQFLGGKVHTATLVRVEAVYGGGLSGIGTLDFTPLVNLMDGVGNTGPHGVIHGLPFSRVQGGTNAVICDPVKGDIGLAVFAERDISAVKANNGAQSNPGSRRRFSYSDGIYLFSVIGSGPTQYVEFTDNGINVTDKNGNAIVTDSSGITINGVKFDRSQNVSGIAKLTSTDDTSLGGGSQPVKLADGTSATKVKAT
jgi:hypothetical protein